MKGRIAGRSLALFMAALIVAPQIAYAEGEAVAAGSEGAVAVASSEGQAIGISVAGEAVVAGAAGQSAGERKVVQVVAASGRSGDETPESASSGSGDLAYAAGLDADVAPADAASADAATLVDAGAVPIADGHVGASGYGENEGNRHAEEAPLAVLGQDSEKDSLLLELLPEWVIPLVFASAGIAVVVCLYRLQETVFPREGGEPEPRW